MEALTSKPKEVNPRVFKSIQDTKQPKGIFICREGAIVSIMDNMEGQAIVTPHYRKSKTIIQRHLIDLAARYSSWRYMRKRHKDASGQWVYD